MIHIDLNVELCVYRDGTRKIKFYEYTSEGGGPYRTHSITLAGGIKHNPATQSFLLPGAKRNYLYSRPERTISFEAGKALLSLAPHVQDRFEEVLRLLMEGVYP